MKQTLKKIIKNTPFINDWYQGQKFKHENENFPMTFEGENAEILNALVTDGFYVIPDYFGKAKCNAVRKNFLSTVKNYPQYTKQREDTRIFGAEHLCPEAMAFMTDQYLQSISDQYYGAETLVGTLLVNHVQENNNTDNLGSGGDWHRDRYLRQFKAIVYLDDVEGENGPFQYIKSSNTNKNHDTNSDMNIMGYSNYEVRFDHDHVQKLIDLAPHRLVTFTAKKGTVILVDTSGIHRGMPLQNGDRFAMFNYYYPSASYDTKAMNDKFKVMLPANYKDQ